MLKTKEYYKILHFLKVESVDRIYPAEEYFYKIDEETGEEVPVELEDHIYTASAGYAWMSVWEYEARVMNDEQKNAKSYGKWLFAVVDDAIDLYKKSHGIADDEDLFVMNELITHRFLRW